MALPIQHPERLPLESGDRLSREEFHRRYEQWPEIKKAELIDGTVYVASPVYPAHARAHACVVGWLSAYMARISTVDLLDNATISLAGDHEVQPDVALRWRESTQCVERPGRAFDGPPELVVEVAASSASNDLHQKRALYERSGVQEYVVWQVYDRVIRWFRLHDGKFGEVDPGEANTVESAVFPGLRLNCEAMLSGDLATVLAAVQPPGS